MIRLLFRYKLNTTFKGESKMLVRSENAVSIGNHPQMSAIRKTQKATYLEMSELKPGDIVSTDYYHQQTIASVRHVDTTVRLTFDNGAQYAASKYHMVKIILRAYDNLPTTFFKDAEEYAAKKAEQQQAA